MAWEWVAPVATAAVGIVGVAATFFSGERARRAQVQIAEDARTNAREDKLRDERREAYMRMLTALDQAEGLLKVASRCFRVMSDEEEKQPQRDAARKQLVEVMPKARQAGKDLVSAGLLTMLLAPTPVRSGTVTLLVTWETCAVNASKGLDAEMPIEVLAPLRVAMHDDLGIPPVDDGFRY